MTKLTITDPTRRLILLLCWLKLLQCEKLMTRSRVIINILFRFLFRFIVQHHRNYQNHNAFFIDNDIDFDGMDETNVQHDSDNNISSNLWKILQRFRKMPSLYSV